jgi:hypothetical protein
MNSLLRPIPEKVSTMNEVNKRLFQPDVSVVVSQSSSVRNNILEERHFNEMQNEMWKNFCHALCSFELAKYKHTCALETDPKFSKERRYYVSTSARRMFKRLMVLQRFEETPINIVDIASALHISHKAATSIVKDSIGFDTIQESIVDNRKKYMAQDWWADALMQNGAHKSYVLGEDLMQARLLYNEFARRNHQKHGGI